MTNIDPCWLPSAIMQTSGAIIGIFSVVFIFSLPRLFECFKIYKSQSISEYEKAIRDVIPIIIIVFSIDYMLIVSLGCLSIYSSMLWLKCLTTETSFINLGLGSPVDIATEQLFTGLLIGLGFYAVMLLSIELLFQIKK